MNQKKLKSVLKYFPKTGKWKWKKTLSNRIQKGEIAGTIHHNGYRRIQINNTIYQSSRLAFLYMEGFFPEHEVDHINRIRDDDRWCNLRHVSRSCNSRNNSTPSNNTSGVVGVSWNKRKQKWRVYIFTGDGKQKHIGYFSYFISAVRARWKAEKKYNYPSCDSKTTAYLYLKKFIFKMKEKDLMR